MKYFVKIKRYCILNVLESMTILMKNESVNKVLKYYYRPTGYMCDDCLIFVKLSTYSVNVLLVGLHVHMLTSEHDGDEVMEIYKKYSRNMTERR